jgi:serine/threonine-protein kinase
MTGEPETTIERLFELALGCEPHERTALLDRMCGSPEVRREVESLLAADAQAEGFLEPPARAVHGPGDRIGPYRLLRKISEGETSSVYLAARDDGQYQQQIAIKLLRPAVATQHVLQRFYLERQILASLIHPNIARLLDGGSTALGQPYLVMEYVDGEPLDVHCRRRKLTLTRRLDLFVTICQAVHFAHRSLVVHRDLKPGNILIDANGAPKLLDFGIAKLLDPDLVGVHIERTATVVRVMTPTYASPEQVLGKPIGTSSDVYSLGVILYGLLTGAPPYELGSQPLREIERIVCELTPPPPSQRAGASRRERLPGDLDKIVLMAMRKEPERRYASAQELADDVRRCLAHRPVLAQRDTWRYRLGAFARRNVAAVVVAAVIAVLLLGGAIAITGQWRRAVAAQLRAETQQRVSEQTLAFLVELFKISDPDVPAGDVRARTLLDHGVARLRSEPPQSASARTALQHTLGVVYRNLGDYASAAALLEDAIAARSAGGDTSLELAESLFQLGGLEAVLGKPDRAVALLRRALAIRTQRLGADDPGVADVLEELAYNAIYKLSPQEAEDDRLRALQIRRRHPGDGLQLSSSLTSLAELYAHSGRHDEADALIREAMTIRGRGSAGDVCKPGDGTFFNNIGLLRYSEGYFDEAERYIERSVECLQRSLGPGHPDVVDVTSTHVTIWREQGRYAQAEALARQSLPLRKRLYGDDSPAVDNALYHLAWVLYERDKLDEAEQLEISALGLRERRYGRRHRLVARSLASLGEIRLARGDAAAAEASYREALDIFEQTGSEQPPEIARALRGLAEALLARNQLAAARSTAEHALSLQRRHLRPMHPAIASTLAVLGEIQLVQSPADAEPVLREALAIRTAAFGPDHPYRARAESLLGACLAQQQRLAEALPLLRHGADTLRAQLGDEHPAARQAASRLQRAVQASRSDR